MGAAHKGTTTLIVIMGVSGCGKSTISTAFGRRKNWPVLEADDFHSVHNIEKMEGGIPLTDDDRAAWLDSIDEKIASMGASSPIILACSALTPYVQNRLTLSGTRECIWVWLDGSVELIAARMKARQQHFMPVSLLDSQFAALAPPEGALRIDIGQSPAAILDALCAALNDQH